MLDGLGREWRNILEFETASSIYWLAGPGTIIEFSFLKYKKGAKVFSFRDYWGGWEITHEVFIHEAYN